MLDTGETIFAFRSEGVIRIIRKLDSGATRAGPGSVPSHDLRVVRDPKAEEDALRALATWEEACR